MKGKEKSYKNHQKVTVYTYLQGYFVPFTVDSPLAYSASYLVCSIPFYLRFVELGFPCWCLTLHNWCLR
mgnify:CR=1 FL=1